MAAGRSSSFEVVAGGKVLHSKLGGAGWPNEPAVIEAIKKLAEAPAAPASPAATPAEAKAPAKA